MAKQRVKDEKRVDPRLIHQYLLDKGLSEEHALGMMANMKAESNFIAGRKEEGGGSGIGLFQHSGVRKPQMLAAINNDLQNWKGQIDFALSEADTKNYISKKFSSPEEATIWFMKNWERPADQSAAKQQERIDRFFIGYDKGNYNANYKIPTDTASYTTAPTDLPTNTPDQLRITTLEEQNKQLAEDFKKAHEDLAQKEKLEKESSTVKELTKAEQDQQNRAKFLEAYSAPQEDVAQETPQALPSANDLGLYTQNLGFDVQQAGQLFSTGQPAQQTFAEGGKTDKPENYKILPETFNYEGRPGARYRRDNYGNWLIADKNTDGKFVAVKDASGERQAELNRRAVSSETGKTANEYAQKESKDSQKRFEQEAWNDYDKMSTSERVLDRVQAGMVDPIGMASRFISGEQAYIPGMGKGLLNTESGEYQKYLKSVGYTPGKFEASDLQNMLNPMYRGASAGNQLDKGNTAQGLVEVGLAFAGAGQGKSMSLDQNSIDAFKQKYGI